MLRCLNHPPTPHPLTFSPPHIHFHKNCIKFPNSDFCSPWLMRILNEISGKELGMFFLFFIFIFMSGFIFFLWLSLCFAYLCFWVRSRKCGATEVQIFFHECVTFPFFFPFSFFFSSSFFFMQSNAWCLVQIACHRCLIVKFIYWVLEVLQHLTSHLPLPDSIMQNSDSTGKVNFTRTFHKCLSVCV